MAKFNGYPSWNAWNVCLWIDNEYGVYLNAREVYDDYKRKILTKEEAICDLLRVVSWAFGGKTPDGAKVSKRACKIWLENQD